MQTPFLNLQQLGDPQFVTVRRTTCAKNCRN
jgi:hypothetical protein